MDRTKVSAGRGAISSRKTMTKLLSTRYLFLPYSKIVVWCFPLVVLGVLVSWRFLDVFLSDVIAGSYLGLVVTCLTGICFEKIWC